MVLDILYNCFVTETLQIKHERKVSARGKPLPWKTVLAKGGENLAFSEANLLD